MPRSTPSRTVPSRRPRALRAIPLVLALGVTAGCGASAGPTIGFHEFTMAQAQDVPDLCDAFFGTEEDLSERLGMELYLEDVQQGGACVYGSSAADDMVALRISERKPETAALVAKGDTYFASLLVMTGGEEGSLDRELREDVSEWLGDRAESVEDDLDSWTAALPATEPGLSMNDGYEFFGPLQDPEADEDGNPKADKTLLTPYGTVSVVPRPADGHLWFDGEPMRPADGEKFVAATVFVAVDEGGTGKEFTLRVDGVDATEQVRDAFDEVVLDQTTQLLVSVPEDASTVDIGVGSAGDDSSLQTISLLDGTIDDDGRSDRLAETVMGSTDADETDPEMLDAAGEDSIWVGVPTPFRSWDITWALVPWTPESGWSPEGQTSLIVHLNADEPEAVAPLTTADATAIIDGVEVPATSYDPATYSFTFSIPEGSDRAEVQTRYTVPATADGFTATGPIIHDISIDLHSGSSVYG